MSFWVGLKDEGSCAAPKHHMLPCKCSKENLEMLWASTGFSELFLMLPFTAVSPLLGRTICGENTLSPVYNGRASLEIPLLGS